jgi:hypothetical protein
MTHARHRYLGKTLAGVVGASYFIGSLVLHLSERRAIRFERGWVIAVSGYRWARRRVEHPIVDVASFAVRQSVDPDDRSLRLHLVTRGGAMMELPFPLHDAGAGRPERAKELVGILDEILDEARREPAGYRGTPLSTERPD